MHPRVVIYRRGLESPAALRPAPARSCARRPSPAHCAAVAVIHSQLNDLSTIRFLRSELRIINCSVTID